MRKFGSAFARRKRPQHRNNFGFLHDQRSFQFSAECERMRVDRNGSPLSILLFTLPQHARGGDGLQRVTEVCEARLRITDTVGQLQDGRIGVLLPDTPRSGACHVAESLCSRLDESLRPIDWEVIVYPDDTHVAVDVDAESEGVDVGAKALRSAAELLLARPTPALKRAIDILVSSLGLLLAAPFFVATGVMIKLTSRGPVFFLQEREGFAGRAFTIVKFRTMRVGAADAQVELRALNERDGPAFKMSNDPRLTRLGRLLRNFCIDELPQLWNVLRGEMTLVGPRPLPTDESRACCAWQRRRLSVTPGLTCFWQISDRKSISFDEWMRMDIRYLRLRSFWQDTRLVLSTARVALRAGRS